jgi:hypothetical protein
MHPMTVDPLLQQYSLQRVIKINAVQLLQHSVQPDAPGRDPGAWVSRRMFLLSPNS